MADRKEMIAMDKIYGQAETGCCPRFDPAPWDDKEVVLQDRLFVKDHMWTFFHIPFGFGKVMVRNMARITEADALAPEPLMLYEDTSLFGADLYIAVAKDVPGAEMARVSGTFLSKVFEGPFKDAGKWVRDMKTHVRSKGRDMKKMFFFYTTCPACAKVYGKSYTVLLAQV
jgi:hypothetical protein